MTIELRSNGTSKGPAWSGQLGEVKSLAGTQTTGLPLMPFEEWAEVRLVASAGIVTLEGPGLEVLRQLEAIVDRLRRQLPSVNPSGVELHEPPPPKPPESPAKQLTLVDTIDPKTGKIIAGLNALPPNLTSKEWFAVHRPDLKPGDVLGKDKSDSIILTEDFGGKFVPASKVPPKDLPPVAGDRIQKKRGRKPKAPQAVGPFPLVVDDNETPEPAPLGITLDPTNPESDDDPETHQPAI